MATDQGAMHSKNTVTYIPGVCNIGPAERARRRQSGIVGTVATIVLLAILILLHAPHAWRLLVFVPAAVGAAGFLQDAFHFCAGFGISGLYNVVNNAGITESVTNKEFRRKDRNTALKIAGFSVAIGASVAALSLI